MAVENEYRWWRSIGVLVGAGVIVAGLALGWLSPPAPNTAAYGANMRAPAIGGADANGCANVDHARARALFPTCWSSGLGEVIPGTPAAVESAATFLCTFRTVEFDVRYFHDVDDRPYPPFAIEDLVTPDSAVETASGLLIVEIDGAAKQYRVRSDPAGDWRIDTRTGTDKFRIEAATRNFLCLDVATVATYAEGKVFYCGAGINLQTLEYQGFSIPNASPSPAEQKPAARGARQFGACRLSHPEGAGHG